jgi:hypothetical protein
MSAARQQGHSPPAEAKGMPSKNLRQFAAANAESASKWERFTAILSPSSAKK